MEQTPQFERRKKAFADLREKFLKDAHPQALLRLKASGKLPEHLDQIGEEAAQAFENVAMQLQTNPDAPKEPGERMAYFQAIPLTAEEIVLHDVVHVPPSA